MTTCPDCHTPITKPAQGPPPKRCPDCAPIHARRYNTEYVRRQRNVDMADIYQFIEAHGPVTVNDIRAQFGVTPKDPGALLVKLQYHGYLCWLDEQNRIYPHRRIEV